MSNQRGDVGLELIIIVVVTAIMIMWASCGYLVDDEKVSQAVEKMGYSNVELVGKSVFFSEYNGCGGSDDVMFDAKAVNPKGERVSLIVCAGWPFKGVTVRTE